MDRLEQVFLGEINSLIDQRLKFISEMNDGQKLLTTICRHLCVSENAKRMRPLLCLYYYLMFKEEIKPCLVDIAVTAEFIHAASLLHDDIIDEADKRRGQSSANYRFGNAQAVLAGDYLLTEAFDLLRPFDRSLCEKAILVVRQMAIAAIREYNTRGRLESKEALSSIAQGKTGILFSWCGYSSAVCAGDTKGAQILWDIGERIGLIFQIADDLKDFDGDKELKDVCRDLRNKEPSMPMILAINKSPSLRAELKRAFLQEEIDEAEALRLKNLIIDAGGIKEAQSLISSELDHIMSSLFAYQGTVGKKYIDGWLDIFKQSELSYQTSF